MSQCGSGSDTSSSLLAWLPVAPLKTRDGVADGRTDGFGSGSRLSLWRGYGVIHPVNIFLIQYKHGGWGGKIILPLQFIDSATRVLFL